MLASTRAGISHTAKAVRALPKSNLVKLAARMESSAKTASEEVGSFTAADRITMSKLEANVSNIENNIGKLETRVESRLERFESKLDSKFDQIGEKIANTQKYIAEEVNSVRVTMVDRISASQKELSKEISALEAKTTEKVANSQYKVILATAGLVGFAYLAIDKRLDEIRNDIKDLHKANAPQPTTNIHDTTSDQKKNNATQSYFQRVYNWCSGSSSK